MRPMRRVRYHLALYSGEIGQVLDVYVVTRTKLRKQSVFPTQSHKLFADYDRSARGNAYVCPADWDALCRNRVLGSNSFSIDTQVR